MAIGSINLNASGLLGFERNPAESRRLDAEAANAARKAESQARVQADNGRQDFVLGTNAYRRVLATLETDQTAASSERVQRENAGSYTGQRAQRAYQATAGDKDRESLAQLFGVDLFA